MQITWIKCCFVNSIIHYRTTMLLDSDIVLWNGWIDAKNAYIYIYIILMLIRWLAARGIIRYWPVENIIGSLKILMKIIIQNHSCHRMRNLNSIIESTIYEAVRIECKPKPIAYTKEINWKPYFRMWIDKLRMRSTHLACDHSKQTFWARLHTW